MEITQEKLTELVKELQKIHESSYDFVCQLEDMVENVRLMRDKIEGLLFEALQYIKLAEPGPALSHRARPSPQPALGQGQ
jgi:hypothetical protein